MDPSRILEHCPELISHHDADGIFEFASAAASVIVGRTPDELVGTSIIELACEEDRARFADAWQRALVEGEARGLRFRVRRGEALVQVETSVRVLREDAGRTAVCVTRSIATSEGMSHTHWEALVKLVPGLVWCSPIHADGSRGEADFISDYLERATGYTAEEWLSTPNFWTSIIHPDDLERTLEETARALEDGSPGPVYRVFARDGKVVYFQSFLYVLRNAQGKPERLYGLTLDVTKFKENELLNATLLAEVLSLSAPVIPVGQTAIVIPLIGALDATRMELVLRNLVQGVAERGARVAILDLTSVPSFDAEGAAALVRAARAARLLGARVVLCGIRPAVARALISLNLSLDDLPTRATLLQALEELR